ncbi:MAG: AAA family ATPase [Bryobacter sp.]|jgi:pilus assembly protein CpaE|nr:AAA family ATPase [Bryobacter sp. CoA8 C33]
MPINLLIASSEEAFRESVKENLASLTGARVAAEYPEVSANLYIRILQDAERYPDAALVVDLSANLEDSLKSLEKVKQAIPDLYVVASHIHSEGETVIAALRAGANDYLLYPFKRLDFREAMSRLERAPRREIGGGSRLGKIHAFLGVKGGVGTTTLATNFAAVLAQRKQQTVLLDLDWIANDVCMQLGLNPQYTLAEVGENLDRMDQSLFEGFVTRDSLGFYVVGPPDALEHSVYFTEAMFRDFSTFLVEKYESIVVDCGRALLDETVLAALQTAGTIFVVTTQDFPALRNAQRYLGFLTRMGFTQDQIRIVVNQYRKKGTTDLATLEQIQQTLNQNVFFGIPPSAAVLQSINRGRPFVADRQAAGDLDKVFRAFVTKAIGGRASADNALGKIA